MRYPPALIYTLRVSHVYRAASCLTAIILIALCAYSMPAIGHFGFINWVGAAFSALACVGLLRDAWRAPQGQLHFAQGVWHWLPAGAALADASLPGTCTLHIDLQSYMLVSFTPQSSNKKFFHTTTQWFHLEDNSQEGDAAQSQWAASCDWLALRRAVLAGTPRHEASAHAERVA